MLALDAGSGRACPIHPGDTRSERAAIASLEWLAPLAARRGWLATRTPKGAPSFSLPDGAVIGFEPGGQIEYSSAPCHSASALLRDAADVVAALRGEANDSGIDLLHVGIDPVNPFDDAPLCLDAHRYASMDAYFESRGPSGRVMMRQTAATQISLDYGPPEQMVERWRTLERMTPIIVAIFASSPRYAGSETGHRSFRSHIWRTLDPARTGLVITGQDPAADYLDFALDAPSMLHRSPDGEYTTFRALVATGAVDLEDFADHLSMLFPEVRPRGHFELRSSDAAPIESLPALIALLGGIIHDARALRAAAEILDGASCDLVTAGRLGLADASLAQTARELFDVALSGCLRLDESFLSRQHVEEAAAFARMLFVSGPTPIHAKYAEPTQRQQSQAAASAGAPR